MRVYFVIVVAECFLFYITIAKVVIYNVFTKRKQTYGRCSDDFNESYGVFVSVCDC